METGFYSGSHYEILELDPGCSLNEIKRSFRAKAKLIHPDVAGAENRGGSEAMLVLIKAYRVLSDQHQREAYDKKLGFDLARPAKPAFRFNYREYLRRQRSFEGYSRLIFFDLFHDGEKEALDLYDFLVNRHDYEISNHLDREDFMDCAFVLAEEYEKRGQALKAVGLLTLLMEFEQEKAYFRHFAEEVLSKLKLLVNMRHVDGDSRAELRDFILRLLDLDLPARDLALFCRKAAELSWDLNDREAAVNFLSRGLDLDSKLPGFKRLQQKMKFCHSV